MSYTNLIKGLDDPGNANNLRFQNAFDDHWAAQLSAQEDWYLAHTAFRNIPWKRVTIYKKFFDAAKDMQDKKQNLVKQRREYVVISATQAIVYDKMLEHGTGLISFGKKSPTENENVVAFKESLKEITSVAEQKYPKDIARVRGAIDRKFAEAAIPV